MPSALNDANDNKQLNKQANKLCGSPRIKPSLVSSRQSKKTLLGVSLEARTNGFLCKLTFNVELVNGNLEVVDKLVEVPLSCIAYII